MVMLHYHGLGYSRPKGTWVHDIVLSSAPAPRLFSQPHSLDIILSLSVLSLDPPSPMCSTLFLDSSRAQYVHPPFVLDPSANRVRAEEPRGQGTCTFLMQTKYIMFGLILAAHALNQKNGHEQLK